MVQDSEDALDAFSANGNAIVAVVCRPVWTIKRKTAFSGTQALRQAKAQVGIAEVRGSQHRGHNH